MKIINAVLIAAGWLVPFNLFADFYVSPAGSDCNPPACGTLAAPFATIDYARQAVRAVNSNMSGDIHVYLRAGTYVLPSTLAFDSGDSGINGHNVIFQSYNGEPVSISGGKRISGWMSATLPNGQTVWKANAGALRFRQLYVNGSRAIRARSPNAGSFYNVQAWDFTNQSITLDPSKLGNWGNLNAIEVVEHQEWEQQNMRLASVNPQSGVITGLQPDSGVFFSRAQWISGCCSGTFSNGVPIYFENALEFLDSPGEWYEDSGTGDVYYMPRSGEDLTSADVEAPMLEELINLQGSASGLIQNIQFYGLNFEYSTWVTPSSYGFSSLQDDVLYSQGSGGRVPGAVYAQYANNLRFERNRFQHMGGAGMDLAVGVQNSTLIGNVFQDISAAAVDVYSLTSNPANPGDVCAGITIKDNYITGTGRDYQSSAAIFGGYVASMVVDHNEITDVGYTGVSIGWGWTANSTALQNNLVRFNRIHGVMTQMADGAGIYTLSLEPGTQVVANYIYDLTRNASWPGGNPIAGIYLDEQSSQITVQDNVIQNITGNWTMPIFQNVNGPGNAFINNDGADPTTMANAGIEAAYADIVTGVPPPNTIPPAAPRLVQIQ